MGKAVRAFADWKFGNLTQVKSKINLTGYHSILQHHVIPSGMRLVGQGFVLMQDNAPTHSSKHSRATEKQRWTAHSSTDVLTGEISGLQSHWTNVRWTWPISRSSTSCKCGSLLVTLAEILGRIIFILPQFWGEGILKIFEVVIVVKKGHFDASKVKNVLVFFFV